MPTVRIPQSTALSVSFVESNCLRATGSMPEAAQSVSGHRHGPFLAYSSRTVRNDARTWLRENGQGDVADTIDRLMEKWKARGVTTRRNWWDVLAGDKHGNPKVVDGVTFPVFPDARRRQGYPPLRVAPKSSDGDSLPLLQPSPAEQRRARRQRIESVATKTKRAPRHQVDPSATGRLTVRNFAQLSHVEIPLSDLVVLVGPQATGKSLILELMKLAVDRKPIVRSLRQHGFGWTSQQEFSSLYFGGGFGNSWHSRTEVVYEGLRLSLADVAKPRGFSQEDAVFYIPAHRTLAIAEGWPRSFAQYQVETPYVARRFSEQLLTALNQGLVGKGTIFPHDRRLKDAFRKLIDDAIFHGATLKLDTIGMRKQFVLEYVHDGPSNAEARIPFMAWTAGQREFTPMLLGLYHLLPAGGATKKREISWAIIEEPEMGLHPKAVVAVMAVVLDLLARGYKVALSTHSTTVLEVVWGMSRLKHASDRDVRLCRMMGLPERDKKVLHTASEALKRTFSVVHLQHGKDGRVTSTDISGLDPGASDPREWEWGGLTGFSARVAEAVASSTAKDRVDGA